MSHEIIIPKLRVAPSLDEPLLRIDLDDAALQRARSFHEYVAVEDELVENGVLVRSVDSGDLVLVVDFRPIGEATRGNNADQERRYRLVESLHAVLNTHLNFPYLPEDSEQPIAVALGGYINNTGRMMMAATVRWPLEAPDADAQAVTSSYMQRAARDMRHLTHDGREATYMREIYASINRDRGVTLQTNELGSCSIGSDGNNFLVELEDYGTVTLFAHNIFSPEQQFICLVGAVAFARAAELA